MLKNAFWLFAIAFLILLMFLPLFSRLQDVKQKDLDYQTRIKELEEDNARLVKEKRLLEEDPEYLEKVAREKMGLIREGEVIYQMPVRNTVK